MRKTTALVSMVFWLVGCGGESSSDGAGGGGSGGAVGGSGGAVGGSGGAVGGSAGAGGAVGGAGGAVGGAGGAVGGAGGAVGGAGGAVGGSGGTGGGGPAKPECASDGDCKIFSDCCSCLGVPTSENPSSCPAMCIQDKCGELSAPKQAACVAGRCVTGFACDSSKVLCKSLPPTCSQGQVPLVNPTTNCWQGGCVPANECKTVKGCSDCTGPLVCAMWITQLGNESHCVDIPASCGKNFSCACMGPSVCTGGFSSCQDFSGQMGVSCSCPAC